MVPRSPNRCAQCAARNRHSFPRRRPSGLSNITQALRNFCFPFLSFSSFLLTCQTLQVPQFIAAELAQETLSEDSLDLFFLESRPFCNPDVLVRRLFLVGVLSELSASLERLEDTRQHIRRLLLLLEACDEHL